MVATEDAEANQRGRRDMGTMVGIGYACWGAAKKIRRLGEGGDPSRLGGGGASSRLGEGGGSG